MTAAANTRQHRSMRLDAERQEYEEANSRCAPAKGEQERASQQGVLGRAQGTD